MDMRALHTIFLFIAIFIHACGEKEDPTPLPDPDTENRSEISFGSILLEDWVAETGKIYEENWELTVNLTEGSSAQKFSIKPNQIPIEGKLELDPGLYTYAYESPSSPQFSDYLPVNISGSFEAKAGKQSLDLEGIAKSKQVVISPNFESDFPELVEPEKLNFHRKTADFYLYFNTDELLKINIPIPESSSYLTEFLPSSRVDLSTRISIKWPEESYFYNDEYHLDASGWPRVLRAIELNSLPASQNETSGLAWIANRLFSINDGENSNEIHEIDPVNGEVVRSIIVENALNVDWEDLAHSDTHLYIGDFGNNLGGRKDLSIYVVSISDLLTADQIQAEKIEFYYPNQTDFSGNSQNHRFDCEAMVYKEGKLHLFTKNWQSEDSDHYLLPAEPGNYEAEFLGTLPIDGLVTAADIDPATGRVVLLGFLRLGSHPLEQWLWFFDGFSGNQLTDSYRKSKIGYIPIRGFPEGITYWTAGNALISSERFFLEGVYDIPPIISAVGLEGLF